MIAVFVPVIIIPTQLTRVKTDLSFAAEDPWNGNQRCTFTLDSYMVTLRGVKTAPKAVQPSRWLGGFHRALRSEADGVTRFLPESLVELWLTKQLPIEALPALLKQMEPSLRKSDYKPILRSLRMKIFGIFEAICCGLLIIIVIVAVAAGKAPWWLAAAIVLAVACACWVFLYQIYFGLLLRRKQQIRWLLERLAARPAKEESSLMTTEPVMPEQPPRKFVFSITPADADGLAIVSKLRSAFPELAWEGGERTSGGIHLAGESREAPSRIGVHLLCKNPPGPFTLTIRLAPIDTAPAEADALRARVEKALVAPAPLQTVIHDIKLEGQKIKLANDLLPAGPQTTQPGDLQDFRFDAIMDVPEVMEPSMERRLIKAFPELKWEDPSENWGKVRLLGIPPETPERVAVSIVRREPSGPFSLRTTVSAQDQSEALKSLREVLHRLESALSGWSLSNLPKFKTRPPSGIDINQTEIVELLFFPERPHVRLIGPNADILISKSLLEALAMHGEMLDSRAKEPKKYPGSNDEESRLAGMRGARARAILAKADPAGSDKDLEVELGLVREASYLAGELLENGLAEVALHRTPPISLRRINVHYFGSRAAPTAGFGFISYGAEDAGVGYFGEILHLNWWVA